MDTSLSFCQDPVIKRESVVQRELDDNPMLRIRARLEPLMLARAKTHRKRIAVGRPGDRDIERIITEWQANVNDRLQRGRLTILKWQTLASDRSQATLFIRSFMSPSRITSRMPTEVTFRNWSSSRTPITAYRANCASRYSAWRVSSVGFRPCGHRPAVRPDQ